MYKIYAKLIFLERKSTKLLKKVIEYGKKYLILYFYNRNKENNTRR